MSFEITYKYNIAKNGSKCAHEILQYLRNNKFSNSEKKNQFHPHLFE